MIFIGPHGSTNCHRVTNFQTVKFQLFFFMDNIENVKTLFSEYYHSSPIPSCPLCKRRINTMHYIATHIAIYCIEADKHPLPNSLLSSIYSSVTNKKKLSLVRSVCNEWSTVASIIRWCKHPDLGLCYELKFKDGSVSLVPNSVLLKSRSGMTLSKRGYRMRKRNILSELLNPQETSSSGINRNSSPELPLITLSTPNILSQPTNVPVIHTPPSIPSPLFPISYSIPSIYPGSAHHGSIPYILSRITLSNQRISLIKSSVRKWEAYCSEPVKNIGILIHQIESFAVSVIRDSNIQVSHKRNTLQNMMVFLRTLITYEDAQYILIKANSGIKFLCCELRKLNISINKLRTQNSTIESQTVQGKWISTSTISNVSKQARLFTDLLLSKYWTHSSTRFPIINRNTKSLFSTLSFADALFFQTALLWRLFSIWTPQRSGRIVSLQYGGNLIYNSTDSKYLFREELCNQKSSQNSSRSLSSIIIHDDLTRLLDFNLFMIIPKLCRSSLTSNPGISSVFVNKNGSPTSADSLNLMITKLIHTVDPSATSKKVTCQMLRRISQTQFFASDPSVEEINKFNKLADHSFQTSLLYYRLFKEASSTLNAMNTTPTNHISIWN